MKIALKFSKERNDNAMISVEVSELTKEYAVVNGATTRPKAISDK